MMTLHIAGITRAHYSDSWGLCENMGKHSTREKGFDGNYIVFATMGLWGYWQEITPKGTVGDLILLISYWVLIVVIKSWGKQNRQRPVGEEQSEE